MKDDSKSSQSNRKTQINDAWTRNNQGAIAVADLVLDPLLIDNDAEIRILIRGRVDLCDKSHFTAKTFV